MTEELSLSGTNNGYEQATNDINRRLELILERITTRRVTRQEILGGEIRKMYRLRPLHLRTRLFED